MSTPDWATDKTVVFAHDLDHGLVVQRGDLLATEIAEARAVASIETLGDARRVASDTPWVAAWLEDVELDLDLFYEPADPVEDTVVGPSVREDYIESSCPVPWDASRRTWLPHEVTDTASVGGASPGGHIDGITFTDPDAALAALREAGYQLVKNGDALRTTLSFPNFGD